MRHISKIPYRVYHGDQVFECVSGCARDAICELCLTYDEPIDGVSVLNDENEWIEISRKNVDRLVRSIRGAEA